MDHHRQPTRVPDDDASTPPDPTERTHPPLLVGRHGVLAAADVMLAGAAAGRGRVLLITGEAGIGKTTVAREIARRAAGMGMATRWGTSFEAAAALPYGVWIECLRDPDDDPCAQAAALLDGLDTELASDAAEAGRRRVRRLRDVVRHLRLAAKQRPQVLVLEDLHWADDASLELLAAVAAAVPAVALTVVATYRDDELDPEPLATLGGGAERIELGGLGEDAVGQLLADALDRPPSADEVARVHRQTAGNPLFVTQLLRLPSIRAAGSPDAMVGSVPAPLRDVLARRLARVTSHCDHVLGAAAAIGFDFDVATLAAIVAESPSDVVAALDEATAARLVVTVGDSDGRRRFVHDLIRLARYEALTRDQRERWHRRATDVLDSLPAIPPVLLAHHASRAGLDPDDPRLAGYQVAAARDAIRRMAWSDAIALAGLALRSAPAGAPGDDLRGEAWLTRGEALLRDGDHGLAAAAFGHAADLGRQRQRAELVARAALGFGAGLGSFEVRLFDRRQLDLLEEAAAALDERAPLRPLVLARLSVALSMMGDVERRRTLADEAVALARRHHDGSALAAGLAARCDALAGPDHVAERIDAASEIVDLAQRAGNLQLELLGRRLRVVALLERRDLAGFDVEVLAYDRTANALGDPFYGWYADLWRAMRAHADGRLDEAEHLADRAADAGTEAGSRNAELLRRVLKMFVHLDRGEGDPALGEWHAVVADDPEMGELITVITALIDSRSGRVDAASATVQRGGPALLDDFEKDQEWLANLAQAVSVATRTGNRTIAARAYELLSPYEGMGVFEGIATVDYGVVDRFLAMAAGCCGDTDAALRHTEQALALVPGSGRLVEAHTRADCARGLLATGDDLAVSRAGYLAREARDTYVELGLDWLTGEARDILDALPSGAHVGDRVHSSERTPSPPAPPLLVREGDVWAFTFEGRTVRVRHAKGVADLAQLLTQRERAVHVRTLEGVNHVVTSTSHQPALDDEAVRRYRERLRELDDELDEADRHADVGRAARLVAERDALVAELTGAFGLAGRRRAVASDPDERLRKAVSARVKAAIERVEALHPALGRHLRTSVRTGYLCSYEPDRPIDWTVVTQP